MDLPEGIKELFKLRPVGAPLKKRRAVFRVGGKVLLEGPVPVVDIDHPERKSLLLARLAERRLPVFRIVRTVEIIGVLAVPLVGVDPVKGNTRLEICRQGVSRWGIAVLILSFVASMSAA
jgi:hypothetical protein